MHKLVAILVAIFCVAASAADEEDFNAHTIRASDVPGNAPRFEEYPVGTKFRGSVAAPDVKSHPLSRAFRTMIREGAKNGPNFAGHYTVVFWGCGAGCISLAIADANSGKVFHPENLQAIDTTNVDFEGLENVKNPGVRSCIRSFLTCDSSADGGIVKAEGVGDGLH